MKTITITKEDLLNAQKAIEENKTYSNSCLVLQALRREGYNALEVGFTMATTAKGIILKLENTRDITYAESKDWPNFVGKEFQIL